MRYLKPFLLLQAGAAFELFDKVDSGYKACGQVHQAVVAPGLDSDHLDVSPYCDVDNQPYLGSMALCLKDSLVDEDYIDRFLAVCPQSLSKHQFDEAYTNATKYAVNSSSSLAALEASIRLLSFSRGTVLQVASDISNFDRTNNYSVIFGATLIVYWFFVCIVAGIIHWTRSFFPNWSGALLAWAPVNHIRRLFIIPPTFKKAHFNTKKLGRFEWLVPLRMESILLAIYFILSAVFCGVEINNASDRPVYLQVGNRSGILTIFAFPVLILFAGRNNFLQFVTGWQYTRFLIFHRWIARVSFLMLMVHVGTKTMTLKSFNSYPSSLRDGYILWGLIAAVAMGCIIGFSMFWLRRTRYELFLITHYILAILLIAGGFVHVKHKLLEGFFIACIAVWGFNFLVRGVRLALFGVQEATIELKANETIRVVSKRPSWWKPHPGSHAFVHFLTPTAFWQSHPFTLVDEPEDEHTIGMYVKIKGGVTHGLYQKLLNAPGHTLRVKVMVEGPYFERMPVEIVDRAVFIASGNGIPGMYAGAKDFAINYPHRPVKLVWIIRDYSSLTWFTTELRQLQMLNMEVMIYVSRGSKERSLDFGKNESEKSDNGAFDYMNSMRTSLSHIEFIEGRPDMRSLVGDELAYAGNNSTGFVTCGHPAMVDDIRAQIVQELARDPSQKIELFEQFQMW